MMALPKWWHCQDGSVDVAEVGVSPAEVSMECHCGGCGLPLRWALEIGVVFLSFAVKLFVFGADFAKMQPMLLVSLVLGGCGLWRDLVVLGWHIDCH